MSNELMIKRSAELAALDPELAAMMESQASEYLGNMPTDEVKIPRIVLMQGLSGFVGDGIARVGQFAHSVSAHIYLENPSDSLTIIPLYYWRSRVWSRPINEEGGAFCRSDNALTSIGPEFVGRDCSGCPMKEWSEGEEQKDRAPKCSINHNWAVMLPDEENEEHKVAVLQMSKTSYTAGKEFNNRLRPMKGAPFFHQFQMGSKQDESGPFKYWVPEFRKFSDTNKYDKDTISRDDWQTVLPEAKKYAEHFKLLFESSLKDPTFDESSANAPDAPEFGWNSGDDPLGEPKKAKEVVVQAKAKAVEKHVPEKAVAIEAPKKDVLPSDEDFDFDDM